MPETANRGTSQLRATRTAVRRKSTRCGRVLPRAWNVKHMKTLATSCDVPAPLVIVGVAAVIVGLILILAGAFQAVRSEAAQTRLAAEATSVDWIEKVLIALRDYPLGRFLIVIGIALMLLGGLLSGSAGIEALVSNED